LRGLSLTSVAKPLANPFVDALLNRSRGSTGQRVVSARGALRSLLGALRADGFVALVIDQETKAEEGGVFVDFFGVPAPMSGAAGRLALRLGCPVYPVFCVCEAGGRYRAYARPAVDPGGAGDPAVFTARIAEAMESEIRRRPDQWLWMYKRWKRVKPGASAGRYPFYANGE
jgi:KDO2-lipid IV(A) lauroyltransferase